jgi:hypothetical protein
MANDMTREFGLHIFDFGAESAVAIQPRATPWVSELIDTP